MQITLRVSLCSNDLLSVCEEVDTHLYAGGAELPPPPNEAALPLSSAVTDSQTH